MEIGMLIAIILIICALALAKTGVGRLVGETVRIVVTALGLCLVMGAALCRPRRAAV